MSLCEFKGNTENITKRQFEFVSEVLKKRGYTGKEVFVEAVGQTGDNYGSYVKRFTVKFENGEEFRMIAKIAPSNKILRDQRPVNDFFINETLVYNELLPKLVQLQNNVDLPEEDRFKFPICYGILSELTNEIILLEDLDVYNYIMLDKKQPLQDEVVKAVLKNLANFHSLSYVLKYKEPQIFENFAGKLVNGITNPETLPQTEMFFRHAINDMKSLFDNERYTNIINDVMHHLITAGIKLIASDRGSKYSVIQHGDLWTNNVMFQMQDNQPVGCILIDYQLSRESLPVSDIHNLLFNCTDYETRSKHYYEWIEYYHSELDRYLNNFGLRVSYVYPREKLDADLKRYGKVSFGFSLIMINFLMRQTQEAPEMASFENMDFNKLPENFKVEHLMAQTVNAIKKRVEGLAESCFEYGYLTDTKATNFK